MAKRKVQQSARRGQHKESAYVRLRDLFKNAANRHDWFSAERLAAHANCSTNHVNRVMRELKEEGYTVERLVDKGSTQHRVSFKVSPPLDEQGVPK